MSAIIQSKNAAIKQLQEAFGFLTRGAAPGGAFNTDCIDGDGPLTPSFATGAARAAIVRAAQLLGDESLSDRLDRQYGWGKYRRPESTAPEQARS